MSEKIKNEETKLDKSCFLNDSDIINDVLISYKHLVVSIATALNEASNKNIYKTFLDIFTRVSENQALLFDCAFKKGWYQLEEAPTTKVNEAYKKFEKKIPELSCNFEQDE